jgi:hypothetical protein
MNIIKKRNGMDIFKILKEKLQVFDKNGLYNKVSEKGKVQEMRQNSVV